jgi:hypothetical protein
LRPVPDPILRFAYGRRAAERLRLPFELLAPRLGVTRERRRPSPASAPEPAPRTPGRDLEEAVLRRFIACLQPALEAEAGDLPPPAELPIEDVFWDPDCRNLYATLSGLLREQGEGDLPTVERLHRALEPTGNGVDLLAKLLLERGDAPRESPTGPRALGETLRQSLDQLYRRWCDRRLRELSRDIHEAQRTGDGARLESLVEEKSVLSRTLHQPAAPTGVASPTASRTGLGTSRSSS